MRLYILFKFLLGVVVSNYVSSNDEVTLKLKATGCENVCSATLYPDNKTCPSSIRVNDEEFSPKKDGFNIVVIDNHSGRKKTAFFRWTSSPRAKSVDRNFINFFTRIKTSSVVVIVFQKMCSYISETWHRFLKEHAKLKIIDVKESNFIAIIVACKYSCPRTTRGSIPYSYSGPPGEREHSVTIKYKLRTASKYPNGNGENKNGDDGGISYVTIIVPLAALLVGVVILLACCYCHDTYKRSIEQNNHALHYGRAGDEVTDSRTNTNSCASTMDPHNEPLYEELGPLTKPEKKSENLYVDCNELKHSHVEALERRGLMYDEPRTSAHPSAPPMYLHYE